MPHPCPRHCPPERGPACSPDVLVIIGAAAARPVKHAAGFAVHIVIEAAEVGALAVAGRRARRGARVLWLARPSRVQIIERPGSSRLDHEDAAAITVNSPRPAWPFAEPGEVYGTLDIQPASDHQITRADRMPRN
jgi:hypothetical protein